MISFKNLEAIMLFDYFLFHSSAIEVFHTNERVTKIRTLKDNDASRQFSVDGSLNCD